MHTRNRTTRVLLILWSACFSLAIPLRAQIPLVTTSNLIGYWPFNETTGLIAHDATTNGNNGVLHNYAGDNSQWVAGRIGGALRFSCSSAEYVLVTNYPKPTSKMSVSAWAWANSRPTWATIIKNFGNVSGQFHFGLVTTEGDLQFILNQQSGLWASTQEGVASQFPLRSWQHVAAVCDGVSVRLYRNGELVDSAPYDGTIKNPPPMSSLGIGFKTDDTGTVPDPTYPSYWDGMLDDIGIWSRDLSEKEVTAIYTAGLQGHPLTDAVIDTGPPEPPSIIASPQSATIQEGESAVLSVTASGTPPLSYQWQLNGSVIIGETKDSVTISTYQGAGSVQVIVCNFAGCAASTPPATIAVTPLPSIPITTDLIGYWPFDETSGTNAQDLSINGNNGVLQNYPGGNSQWVAGKVGGALSFGGETSSNWVYVANYPKPSVQLTASAWVWANSLPVWGSIIKNFGNDLYGQLHLGLDNNDGRLSDYLAQQDVGGFVNAIEAAAVFPTNSWQHVAVVCDGAAIWLYRNGILVATGSYDGTLKTNGPASLGIGAKTDDTGLLPGIKYGAGFWDGKIDEVALWNRALSSGEINEIYKFGLAGLGITAVNPIPILASVASPGTVTISWSAVPAGECYVLESSVQLPGGSWDPVAAEPTLSNGRYSVNVSVGAGNQFFRLRHEVKFKSSTFNLLSAMNLAGDNLMNMLNLDYNHLPNWEEDVDENYGSTMAFSWPGHNLGRW